MTRRIGSLLLVSCIVQPMFASGKESIDYIVAVLQVLAIVAVISAIVYGILKFIRELRNEKYREREKYKQSFEKLVAQLNSIKNPSAQLSASILLRRYFKDTPEDDKKELRKEAIDVISSLLRVQSTGVLQKTLADGLGFATDLSGCDLQKTNLQDVLLDNKKQDILMNKTDLFLADLSFANIEGIKGHGIIFYNAILFYARIKNCDFTDAIFRGADLNGVVFKNCILKGADFSEARNVPSFIKENLDNENKFKLSGMVSAKHDTRGKTIFFSMPGMLNKEDETITKNYKEFLEKNGYEVLYYKRDDYPRFGQLNRVKEAINRSTGMIAFGFKQIEISDGKYRPGTSDEKPWKGKWLSTPWNEIEVGIGLAVGMPILLVHDRIISEGIFENELSECFVARVLSTEDSRRLEYNRSFQEWYSKL